MRSLSFNEIENKHGQRVYMFSKQPGNTDLEKCINFIKLMKVKYSIFEEFTDKNEMITIVAVGSSFEVFNDKGEKIEEFNDEDRYGEEIKSIDDVKYTLSDLNINLK